MMEQRLVGETKMIRFKHAVYFFVGFFLGMFISATTFSVLYMTNEQEMRDE